MAYLAVAYPELQQADFVKKQSSEAHGEMVLAKVRDQVLSDTDWFDNMDGTVRA